MNVFEAVKGTVTARQAAEAYGLTVHLFGIPAKEAAMKLADDFGIAYNRKSAPSIRPRSREISASIILQSQSQLKALYKDSADTIVENMDYSIFLE